MNPIAGRLPAVLLASIAFSCGGQSAPAPPAASPRGGADSSAALPPGHPPIGEMPPSRGAGDASGSVSGTIGLSAELKDRNAPGDVLYVIARKNGSTVAVRRVEGPSFPLDFEISGADTMGTGTTFDGPLDLVARLSKSGDAIASAGDLEGSASGVAVPSTGVSVTIDTVRQ